MFNDYQLAGQDDDQPDPLEDLLDSNLIYSRSAGCSPIQFSRISVARQGMVSGVNVYIGRRN